MAKLASAFPSVLQFVIVHIGGRIREAQMGMNNHSKNKGTMTEEQYDCMGATEDLYL